MDIKGLFGLARDVWGVIKRPETGFLFLSAVCIGSVDAVWTFYGRLLTRETMALLGFAVLFFMLAVVLASKRGAKDVWKPFFAATLLSLGTAILVSDSWVSLPFVAASAVTTAYLFTRRGERDAS